MKKLFKSKKTKIIVFICLLFVAVAGVSAAATIFASSEVSFDNTTSGASGMSSTNVQSAIEELNIKANTWINPDYIDFGTLATNTAKTILASKNGICIKRNNKVSCFKINNWNVEKEHIQEVFSDISCRVNSSYVLCSASALGCDVTSHGNVRCDDYSDNSICTVGSDGSVRCG